MPDRPTISVIIPAFNAEQCITRAVESVQGQSFQDFEIIVIDDASTDGTAACVRSLIAHDGRIKLISQSANSGPSIARNAGFATARGTWLAILDADDAFKAQRLERLMQIAISHELDMVMDGIELHDAAAPNHSGERLTWFDATIQPLTLETYLEHDVTGDGYGLSICKPLFRRSFLEAHRLSYPSAYRHGEDSYFYTLLLIHGAKAAAIDDAMYFYTTSIGRLTGKRSPFTRTVEDYALKARSVTDLLDEFADRLTPKAREIMHLRRERILDTDTYWKLRRAVGSLRLFEAIKLTIARPRSGYVLIANVAASVITRMKLDA